jgi:8-oxo-dGTP diphosphatase
MKKNYVLGFLFSIDEEWVLLIEKTKPEWQRGKLNGIGGKIEIGERSHDAMVREFKEETSLEVKTWDEFATLSGPFYNMFCYSSHASKELLQSFKSPTEELVEMYDVESVTGLYYPTLPNLQWLIPMALSMGKGEPAASYSIYENVPKTPSVLEIAA